ncbi:adenine phosphoribosyltransferase [Candidatus Gracilibacteria bacterium]|nr:adenine phosphoribosyltransferase [Candidatus Gracilibacteria bacterium]
MADKDLTEYIRNIPDFPQPGIQFKDVTTLIGHPQAFAQVIDVLAERYHGRDIQAIVGVESRGFIFSAPLALRLGVSLVPVRKPGKLPAETYQVEYDLEYGSNKLEIHRDAFEHGGRVVIVDDLLATGGTIGAARTLVERAGASVEELAFVIELSFLGGRDRLAPTPVFSLVQYGAPGLCIYLTRVLYFEQERGKYKYPLYPAVMYPALRRGSPTAFPDFARVTKSIRVAPDGVSRDEP